MIPNKKIQKIFECIGKSVLNYSFLGKGEASVVLKVNTNKGIYTLKSALYPERKKKILNEVKIRQYFIEKGLKCIPQPIYSDNSILPNGAVIYEYIEGKKPNFNNVDILIQFANIISRIHKINFEEIDNGFSNIESLFISLEKTSMKIIDGFPHLMNNSIISAFDHALKEFKQMMNNLKDKFTIGIKAQLHGDLSDNFLIDFNNKIWLLDWENSENGDVVDELCWFLYVNNISLENRKIFFQEYQHCFIQAKKIRLEDIYPLYFAVNPVFNICWGIDQLAMNIKQKLEPERKLRDLAISAKNWERFYSEKTTSMIIKGIKSLTDKFNEGVES